MIRKLFVPPEASWRLSAGLLLLRVAVGASFMVHGWRKIQNPFEWAGDAYPGILQALAAVSEFGGGAALIVGLLFPAASFGILCTMVVATSKHVLASDPFVSKVELPLLFLIVMILFLLQGPGRWSIDAALFGRSNSTGDKK